MFPPSSSAGTFATRAQTESSARSMIDKISNENKFGVDESGRSRQGRLYFDRIGHSFWQADSTSFSIRATSFTPFTCHFFGSIRTPSQAARSRGFGSQVERPGNFELACSQLCGTGHYNMKAPIRVVSQEEYDKWYAGKVQAAATARARRKTALRRSCRQMKRNRKSENRARASRSYGMSGEMAFKPKVK